MTDSNGPVASAAGPLLGPAEIRELAERAGVRPTKTLGQNFVLDGGTVRKIVRGADIVPGERVVEIGPGLGSLTLGLLEAGADLTAVEIDPVLAGLLPDTVRRHVPGLDVTVVDLPDVHAGADGGPGLTLVRGDALDVRELPGSPPTALVANLPYNVSVPVLLSFLEHFPTLERVLVMVQAEVADRLAAPPGSRTYGVPSAKTAWYAAARRTITVGRSVFWPVPNVDSALVRLDRHAPPPTTATREQVFAVVDAAFAQRRKMLRAALAPLAGDTATATAAIEAAGVDPQARGEALDIAAFARVAEQLPAEALVHRGPAPARRRR
ncbi:16S rRNA (adenine(1518)-N(6)/adenine(1519)-N(6))-dimethyltransferase RsmA [Cellulomonas denverensis]|uniref:Ribosomal RNA small subunit methyltransferase A n=1 Tax=Cellulomonas denverensis TaxID=264297 RepID=A0A7X6KSP2_9CELL|nr:16S rRNA (adenine(1518)-N(6)/adenine(1519)-N(6))-dimethyltransferase RsmA [Cellulomonas denverensis]NKY21298.1 16S rRNA (adenine(1518)-N(6)/adenine(1519)-N(6))-dimethyltransferase RsmA [Cellulomonas denverensis]GIG24591.1 ribosomal RNA small subunit methyltransferase A [Cellulomonas denverensis]